MGLMSRLMPQHRGYCCYRVRMTHILVLILVVSGFIYWSSLLRYTIHKAIQLGHQDVVEKCPTKEQKQVGCSEYNANTKQPHILLILSDDQGYNDVGYQGFTQIKTPLIDSLNDESHVTFSGNGVTQRRGWKSYSSAHLLIYD